ncbi:MAG: HlyD family efflux transporter periplasmic adaptor subunit [Saccharofermentans sp.]|nr:HlyD family efflux transporter periplasmic adaptor subunit [Saccharofermentans sp.]
MKKKKSIVPFIVIGGIIIVVGGGIAYLNSQVSKMASVMSAPASVEVVSEDIVKTVSGGGYIAINESININLPAELVISEYLLEVGDNVHEGDVIANIDPASITSAIVSAQTELESINETLKDTSDMTSYEVEEYNTRKDFLNAKIEILTAYYLNPVIVATQDGVISAVGNGSSDSSQPLDLSQYTGMFMKNDPEPSEDETEETTVASEESETTETEVPAQSEAPAEPVPSETEPAPTTPAAPAFTAITDLSGLTITAPVAGEVPQSSIPETDSYTGLITWIPATPVFAPGTPYTAMVTLSAKSGYGFDFMNLPSLQISGAMVIPMATVDGNYVALIAFEPTEGEAPSYLADTNFGLPEDFDINRYIAGYTGAGNMPSLAASDYSALYNAATSSQYSALAAAYSSAGGSAGRPSSNTSENLVATIASTDTAILTIQIDEMDILQVEEGQRATVTFVAIDGEEYTGEITHVSNFANTASGNTKYDVEILINMDDNMRFGMSADATITISEASGVASIPRDALQQTGNQTFVYTAVAEDGSLTGEVAVTTGVSDGYTVEIVSGVEIGDTVYYERVDENPFAAFM